jgi:uncharacterized cofD-like protein
MNSSDNSKARPRDLRVVAIGGGTGLSTLLKGLKRYVLAPTPADPEQTTIRELCGVVTVSDPIDTVGRVASKELNMLPPGDIRNCIVALLKTKPRCLGCFSIVSRKGPGPRATVSGNLFLAALTSITGDFAEAVRLF